MKVKFSETKLYNNYPLYSEKLGHLPAIKIHQIEDVNLYYQTGNMKYNSQGISTNDKLYFKIPFVYSKLYLVILNIISYSVMFTYVFGITPKTEMVIFIPALINIILLNLFLHHKSDANGEYRINLPHIEKIYI